MFDRQTLPGKFKKAARALERRENESRWDEIVRKISAQRPRIENGASPMIWHRCLQKALTPFFCIFHLISIALLVAIPSVANAGAPPSYTVTNDQYEPTVTVVSPAASTPAGSQFVLRSFIDKKTKLARHQLYASISYASGEWRFYNQVFDSNAESHEFLSISSRFNGCQDADLLNRGGCFYTEDFAFTISDADMIAYAKNGASFKFKCKSGFDEVIEFKPSFFAGQLNALKDYVATPYAIDPVAVPATDPGLDLYDMGHINKRLYEGVDHGLNVSGVAKGSPAELAGIKHGDILMDMDAFRIDKMVDYQTALSSFHAGQVVQVKVKQHGQVNTISMTL